MSEYRLEHPPLPGARVLLVQRLIAELVKERERTAHWRRQADDYAERLAEVEDIQCNTC